MPICIMLADNKFTASCSVSDKLVLDAGNISQTDGGIDLPDPVPYGGWS